jgi:hypothetical protein
MSASPGANGRRRAVGEVDAAVRQADVVDDRAEMRARDALADDVLHAIAEGRRLLDARARRCAQVQAELAAVHRREEVGAHPGREAERRTAEQQHGGHEPAAARDDGFEQPAIGDADAVYPALEDPL